MINGCNLCLDKQRVIDRLTEEIQSLKQKLYREEKKVEEGFFGSSTPSAKKPHKKNSLEENQKKVGGGKPGHIGHGRKAFDEGNGVKVIEAEAPAQDRCPHCNGTRLSDIRPEERSVIDSAPLRAEKRLYRLHGKYCLDCRRTIRAKAPSVMPKFLYGNQLITHLLDLHFVQGLPRGRLEETLNIPYSAIVAIEHRFAELFKEGFEKLKEDYRLSPVKHADETGWRTDGANGYTWLFATPLMSIFLFGQSRSSSVAKSVLGETALPGVLVVDRYKGYNQSPCKIQYCYAHLLRKLKDIEKEFSEEAEVLLFVSVVGPLLAKAMSLRGEEISDEVYKEQALQLKADIIGAMEAPSGHLAIRDFQALFIKEKERLYHWAEDRLVPADNNLAERDLRPTVIARKISFGSQSKRGAETRGILMTLMHTLRKRYPTDYLERLKVALDQKAINSDDSLYQMLFN